eukprot:307878-Alexandrium_andersonii.AAC.1
MYAGPAHSMHCGGSEFGKASTSADSAPHVESSQLRVAEIMCFRTSELPGRGFSPEPPARA